MASITDLGQKYGITSRKKADIQQSLIRKCDRLTAHEKSVLFSSFHTKNEMCKLLSQFGKKTTPKNDAVTVKGDFHNADYNMYVAYHEAMDTDAPLKKVKKIAEGEQGVVTHMRVGTIDFARKTFKEMFPKKIKTRTAFFEQKRIFERETGVELATLTLLTECIVQNICPHFPFLYGIDFDRGEINADMQLLKGITLRKWSKTQHTAREWYSVIFQILVSLYCMQSYFGMVHDDLHDDNILVTQCAKTMVFDYTVGAHTYHVPLLGNFVQIIDFGRVHTPKNKMQIGWHLKHRKKLDRREKESLFEFDYRWILESVLQSTNEKVRKQLSQNIMFELVDNSPTPIEVIETFFSNDLHEGQCGKFPCFDTERAKASAASFDLNKTIDRQNLPTPLKAFCRRK